MCKVFVILYYPVFAFFNGFALPIVFIGTIFSTEIVERGAAPLKLGDVWVFLLVLQLVNTIYGLILVCAKSELKFIILPWFCQSFCINTFFFFWSILFWIYGSGAFEATEAITFAFVEAFSIYTMYLVFKNYCEFVEQLTLRSISFCCV